MSPRRGHLRGRARILALAIALLGPGCKTRPPKVPGESDIPVDSLTIVSRDAPNELELDHDALFNRLGQRPGSLLTLDRMWSPYREAEDRRRIEAYWQQFGYFDVEVERPTVTFEEGRAKLEYRVRENTRYALASVHLKGAPDDEKEALDGLLTLTPGQELIDLETFRKVRITMQEYLRTRGYGHAQAYHRAYLDKTKKTIDVFLWIDAGPKTVIGSIDVDGALKVPIERVLARSGITTGEPYHEGLRDRIETDLLDTGAYASVFVRVDTDTKFIPPGTQPDTGGDLYDEQISEDGELIPRVLPKEVNVIIHVVEAPRATVRLRAGLEIDPTRADTTLHALVWLRNAFGPLNHLSMEGRIGYGWPFGNVADDDGRLYGDATVRQTFAGAFGRAVDLRTVARYEGRILPVGFLHRVSTGIGLRSTLWRSMFLDVDLLGFYERPELSIVPTESEGRDLSFSRGEETVAPELASRFVWDGRSDPVEPMAGAMFAVTSRISPIPGPDPIHQPFINASLDARWYVPLSKKISLGFRGFGEWSFLDPEDGIPLGARLFGGGAYGFRGEGQFQFAPTVTRCFERFCLDLPVGGRSLVESSAELRWLPPLKQLGVVAFGDFAGAGAGLNPFEEGPSLAFGLGGRVRIWYLPAAVDVAYRVLRDGAIQGLETEPFRVFFRIGEAF